MTEEMSFQLSLENCQGFSIPDGKFIPPSQVKSSHLYLYSAFNNTNCNKALHNIKIGTFCQCKMTGFNTQLSAECISLLNLVMALSSLNNICAIKSMIVLQVKCPQLSKPEATAARNENSIGDRMEKKPWEKPGSVGGPVPLRPDESVVCSNCSKVSVSGPPARNGEWKRSGEWFCASLWWHHKASLTSRS